MTLFGALLGVLGALTAVPLAATIQIFVQELTAARREKVEQPMPRSNRLLLWKRPPSDCRCRGPPRFAGPSHAAVTRDGPDWAMLRKSERVTINLLSV